MSAIIRQLVLIATAASVVALAFYPPWTGGGYAPLWRPPANTPGPDLMRVAIHLGVAWIVGASALLLGPRYRPAPGEPGIGGKP